MANPVKALDNPIPTKTKPVLWRAFLEISFGDEGYLLYMLSPLFNYVYGIISDKVRFFKRLIEK